MIRINLLGRERPKVYRPIQLTGPWLSVLFVIPLLVTATYVIIRYDQVAGKNEELRAEIAALQAKKKEMEALQAEMKRIQAEEAKVRARIAVIEELQRNQSGPSVLLGDLGARVSQTDTVWLTELTERPGGQIEFKGNAGSVEAIADLITNLGKSEYFNNIEFKESKQVKAGQENEGTYQFTLTAVFAMPKPEPEGAPAQGAAATPARTPGG